MSICSYSNYECTFPIGTKVNPSGWLEPKERDGRMYVYNEDEGRYSETFLDELVKLFDMPLDEVPGLELDAYYQCYEDEGWQCTVHIEDGKVTCQETVIEWRDCTLLHTGVDIGLTNERKAKQAWEALTDVPVDDDGCFVESFRLPYIGLVLAETDREDVWHRIEERLGVSVAWLMGEAKNPDGSN